MRRSYALLPRTQALIERELAELQQTAPAPTDWASRYSFGEQAEAIRCHAPLVCLYCSGRAGKSEGAAIKWLEVCDRKPGEVSAIIALTLKSAKRIVWRKLKRIDKELRLGLTFNVAELTITHPNGSVLYLLGANRDDLIDVLRGTPFAFIYFDEAAFFRENLLGSAIDDALIIRMFDLEGELWIGSTPGYVLSGYHYDVVSGKKPGWRVFRWNYFDNPHLPEYPREADAEKRRALRLKAAVQVRERMGWTEQTPSYVREWLGLYCRDEDALVYAFDRSIHMVDAMPASWNLDRSQWITVLGMDFGSTNATAWVLWAFERLSGHCYCVRVQRVHDMAPSAVADVTKQWIADYHPDVIVGDSAAKGYIDEHRERHQIAIEGADKLHKRAHQMSMNDGFRFMADGLPAPRIHLLRGQTEEYADELEKLGKDPRYDRSHPKYGTEDERGAKDLCDAGLYGWWRCYAWIEALEAEQQAEDLANHRDRRADPDPDDSIASRGDDQLRYLM